MLAVLFAKREDTGELPVCINSADSIDAIPSKRSAMVSWKRSLDSLDLSASIFC